MKQLTRARNKNLFANSSVKYAIVILSFFSKWLLFKFVKFGLTLVSKQVSIKERPTPLGFFLY